MNYLLLLLLILILSIIYTGSQKSSKDRLSVTLLVFLIIVLFGYLQVPNLGQDQKGYNNNYGKFQEGFKCDNFSNICTLDILEPGTGYEKSFDVIQAELTEDSPSYNNNIGVILVRVTGVFPHDGRIENIEVISVNNFKLNDKLKIIGGGNQNAVIKITKIGDRCDNYSNVCYTEILEKGKGYKKNINSIFAELTEDSPSYNNNIGVILVRVVGVDSNGGIVNMEIMSVNTFKLNDKLKIIGDGDGNAIIKVTKINDSPLKEPFELAPVKYTISPNTCDGVDYDKINPVKHQSTDSYDGLIFKENKPKHKKLSVDQVAYHTPTGDAKALNLPEGTDNLFMFSYNRSHPSCCPSTYSSSRGCVCLTDEQKKQLYSRGGNI